MQITEKTLQQHFEGNCSVSSSKPKTNTTRMSVVKTLWTSLTKCQLSPSSQMAVKTCHDSLQTPSAPPVEV
jgi:hypothetical protein